MVTVHTNSLHFRKSIPHLEYTSVFLFSEFASVVSLFLNCRRRLFTATHKVCRQIKPGYFFVFKCCLIASAVYRLLAAAQTQLRSGAISCRIYGETCGKMTGYSSSISTSSVSDTSPVFLAHFKFRATFIRSTKGRNLNTVTQ